MCCAPEVIDICPPIAARGHYPDAVIHAYEPNPRVLQFLDANTSELGIEIHHEAVGGRAGFVRMLYAGDSSNQAQTSTEETGEIPQVSLKTAIDRIGGTVDLLKLDCEGAEWDLFHSDICWQNIKYIRMEYHLVNGKSLKDVKQVLSRAGFALVKEAPCEDLERYGQCKPASPVSRENRCWSSSRYSGCPPKR